MRKLTTALVSLLMLGVAAIPLSSTPAGAANTTLTTSCQGTLFGVSQSQASTLALNVVAPATVVTGTDFPVTYTPGPVTIPSSASGQTVNSITDDVLKFPVPAGTSFVSAALSGGSGLGAGVPSVSNVGGVMTLKAAGPFPGGSTVQLPTITATLHATGAVGSTIATHFAGTSFSNPGYTFTVNISLGAVPTTCFASPNPALSSSTISPAPAVVPGAPTIGTATAGAGSASLSWTAPSNDGGSPITGYRVTPFIGATTQAVQSFASVATTQALTGLANGSAYTFKVAAVNAVGTGALSAASNAVTPTAPTAPGAPTIGTAVAGIGRATVSWSAPASTGGSPVTGYKVTPFVGATAQAVQSFSSVATSQSVVGLTNGTPYTFKVAAVNAIGTGPLSAASDVVTPQSAGTLPGAPTIGSATAGNGQATLGWTAPASDGDSPITGYSVTPFVGGTAQTPVVFHDVATTHVVTGLTNGTTYTLRVAAINAIGTGPLSAASSSVTPVVGTVPGAPTIGTATAGNGQVSVTWTAPASNGGTPITGYRVTPFVSTAAGTPITFGSVATTQLISGLQNGTTYTFTVAAINAVGAGSPSAHSNPVTPVGATSSWSPSGGCGSVQTTQAPAGAFSMTVTVGGGTGGRSGSQASSSTVAGGTGGQAVATVAVSPGQTVSGVVGCNGNDGGGFANTTVPGGYANGGTTGRGSIIAGQAGASGGSGGGASAVCLGASCSAAVASSPVAVGGGGGGGGVSNSAGTPSGPGGAGGAAASTSGGGGAGPSGNGGAAGGSSGGASGGGGGGAGGANSAGGAADGGSNGNSSGGLGVSVVGGGGGGGFVGGGAGSNTNFGCKGAGGGGGGSSWTAASTTNGSFGTASAPAVGVVFSISPPVTVPGPPTIGTATAGNGSATVAWSPPASDGGATVNGYVVTPLVGGVAQTPIVFASTATQQVINGLTNGTTYTFEVAAKNAAGTGAPSLASNAVTPAVPVTVPGAPTIGTATAGNAQATVTWTAPEATGGSPITGYLVTPFVGATAQAGHLFSSTATSQVIGGLANGTTYTFKVSAINVIGPGAPSGTSNAVTPVAPTTVPGAPTIGSATAGNGQATVVWSPPVSDGGTPVIGYVVTPYVGATAGTPHTFSSTATSQPVTGLTNGVTYTFKVAAVNLVGPGPQSAASNTVTPFVPVTVPGAPTIGTATPGNTVVTLTWTAPAADGGSPVTGYVVTPYVAGVAQTAQSFATTATTQQLTHLTNGTTYTFKVAAQNAVGVGPQSAASGGVAPTWGLDATARFVYAAYTDFLGRLPTAAELAAARATLDVRHQSRFAFVSGLAASPEWAGAIVRKMYVDTLGRTGDAAGITFWSTQITSRHRTVAEVAAWFYSSPEYFHGFGHSDVDTWLTDLYHKLLERAPDTAGLAFWRNETATAGRVSVALRMFQSPESRRQRVRALYLTLLGRAPDTAGLTYWSGRILNDGDLALASNLAASNEYYHRAQTRFP